MNLYQYLDKIAAGKTLNAPRCDELLRQHTSHSLSDIGSAEYIKPSSYRVAVKNHSLLNDLLIKFAPATSRAEAAFHLGDSHAHMTQSMYLTARQPNSQLVVLAPEMRIAYDTIILIENADCFTQAEAFLSHMAIAPEVVERSLVVWSMGKAVCHASLYKVFNQANTVYACQDYDLAGLQIYGYLAKHLTPTVEFVMPTTPTQALNKLAQKSPKNSDELYQAIRLANAMGAEAIAGLFKQTRRFIEQEVFLHCDNPCENHVHSFSEKHS